MSVVTLLYHDVVGPGGYSSSGFRGGDADIYKLERREFELHLAEIHRAMGGRSMTTVFELDRVLESALLLTFDDGGIGAFEHTADLLESHGWRGHFFVTTDHIGQPGFLTAEHLRDLHAHGHVVGSHSCSHPMRMSHCDWDWLLREWRDSVGVLSDILHVRVRSASVPGGYFSGRVAAAAARAGITALFTSEPTTRLHSKDGCRILGRYSIRQGMTAQRAGALAGGRLWPRVAQSVCWNVKKVAKAVGGERWLKLRRHLLSRRAYSRDGGRAPE